MLCLVTFIWSVGLRAVNVRCFTERKRLRLSVMNIRKIGFTNDVLYASVPSPGTKGFPSMFVYAAGSKVLPAYDDLSVFSLRLDVITAD